MIGNSDSVQYMELGGEIMESADGFVSTDSNDHQYRMAKLRAEGIRATADKLLDSRVLGMFVAFLLTMMCGLISLFSDNVHASETWSKTLPVIGLIVGYCTGKASSPPPSE